jgi:transcriptional regulator with XRE-family HTH domain
VDLRTARFLRGKSQSDIERETGVFQSKLSRFEKSGIKCLREDEKGKVENYLGLKINWDQDPVPDIPLSDDELEDVRFTIDLLLRQDELATVEWISQYKTSREAFNACKDIINNIYVEIPAPKMNWRRKK